MKRLVLATLALLLALSCALLRERFAPRPLPLPVSPGGVVVIAVAGLPVPGETFPNAPALTRLASRGAIGLVPTRSGAADDADFAAGLRVLLAGSRSPEPGAPTLASVGVPVHAFTGANAVRNADAFASTVPHNASVIVVGVTPALDALERRERLAPVIVWTPETDAPLPRLLTSPSTRNRPGLCALTDMATTASRLAAPANRATIGDGRAMETLANGETPSATWARLRQNAARWGQQAREQKRLPVVPWVLAGLVGAAVFLPNEKWRNAARVAALAAPGSLIMLAPFVPAFAPSWTVYALCAGASAMLALLAARSDTWGHRLPRLLAGLTALVIAVDTGTGGVLLARTPLSYSVLEAARFYGIGNEVSGLFLGAALIAVGTQSAAVTLLWGGAVAVVSGAPTLGADAGGMLAGLVAFGYLVWRRWGAATANPWRGWLLCLTVAGAVVGFAAWDASRPEASRTHLGVAVARMQTRGASSLLPMARRKVGINARLLVTSPWAVLLVVAVIAGNVRRNKAARAGKPLPAPNAALAVAALCLFLLNDSGVVAGATCALWHDAND